MLFPLACFLVLVSLFFPRLNVGNVRVGLDDIALLVFGTLAVLVSIKRVLDLAKPISPMIIFVLVFLPVGLFQVFFYADNVRIPTEIWQYIKRGFAFLIFAYVGRYGKELSVRRMGFLFVFVIFGYQLIGIVQIIGGEVGGFFSSFYARTDHQLELALRENNSRFFGVSGFSNSWGAFSAFSLFAIFGLLSFFRGFRIIREPLYFALCISALILCLINIYYSGSRGAMLATFFSAFYFVSVLTIRKPAKIFLFAPIFVCVGAFLYWFLSKNMVTLDFIIYRFETLIERGGGSRVDQIIEAMQLLVLPHEYIFGVSNRVQRFFAVSHGVEVEFVNILVSYGALGFFLLYFQLFLLFVIFRGKPRLDGSGLSSLNVSARAMILMYLIFSFGYFFYAELIVGVMPWAFWGLVYGLLRREKSYKVKGSQYSC